MKFGNILFLFSLLPLSISQAEEIRILTSDLLGDDIEAPLLAYGAENEVTFSMDSIGSLLALERLRANEMDLAIIAVPEGTSVPGEEFSVYPFAYDAAIIVVNKSSPIDEISLAYLGGIFGANEEYRFNAWGDLGLAGWQSRTIKPLIGISDDSIALELFKYSVFRKKGGLNPSVAVVKDDEVEELVRSNIASVAILSRMPDSEDVKVLPLSGWDDDGEATAFGPTEDNIHYGDYPIRLAFYIVYNKRDEEKLRGVIRFLLEDEVAESLRENGLFALPDTVRHQLIFNLDFK